MKGVPADNDTGHTQFYSLLALLFMRSCGLGKGRLGWTGPAPTSGFSWTRAFLHVGLEGTPSWAKSPESSADRQAAKVRGAP